MIAPLAPPAHPVIPALRQATQEQHTRIELVLKLDATLSLPRYIAVLQGFHGFLVPWEARVRATLPGRLHGWFDARKRAPLARRDLDFLHAEASDAHGLAAQAAHTVPLDNLAQALGSMYVLEGSALGGQVLAPQLARTLGVSDGAGGNYFLGFGARTGAMWREFRELAESELGTSPPLIDAAAHAAHATFGALIASFEKIDEEQCA